MGFVRFICYSPSPLPSQGKMKKMSRSFEYPVAGVPRAFLTWVLTIGSFAMNVELDDGSGGTHSPAGDTKQRKSGREIPNCLRTIRGLIGMSNTSACERC
jgi:hypothetical protein